MTLNQWVRKNRKEADKRIFKQFDYISERNDTLRCFLILNDKHLKKWVELKGVKF